MVCPRQLEAPLVPVMGEEDILGGVGGDTSLSHDVTEMEDSEPS